MATQNEALRRKYNNLPPAEKKKYGSFAKYSAQHSSSQGNDKSDGKENRYAGDAVSSKSSGKPKTSGTNSKNRMAGDKVKQEAANSYNQSSQASNNPSVYQGAVEQNVTGQQQNNAKSSSGPKGYISEETQNDPKYAHKPTNQLMRRYRAQMEAIGELEAKPSLTAKEQEQLQKMKAAAERMKSGEYTKPTFENKSQTDPSMINLPPGWKKNPEGGYIDDKGQRKSHIPNKYYGPNGGNGNQPKPNVEQPGVKPGANPTQSPNWKDMGWTTPGDNPNMSYTQAIEMWHNPETGETVAAPNSGYQPPAGSAWTKDTQAVNLGQQPAVTPGQPATGVQPGTPSPGGNSADNFDTDRYYQQRPDVGNVYDEQSAEGLAGDGSEKARVDSMNKLYGTNHTDLGDFTKQQFGYWHTQHHASKYEGNDRGGDYYQIGGGSAPAPQPSPADPTPPPPPVSDPPNPIPPGSDVTPPPVSPTPPPPPVSDPPNPIPPTTGPIVNVPTYPPPTTYPGVEVGNPGDGSSTNIGEGNAGVGGNNEVGDMFNQDKEFVLKTGGGNINNYGNLNSDLSVNFNYNDMFNATAGGGSGSNVGANWNMGDSIFNNNMNAMATIALKDNQDARNTGQFMNTYMQGLQMSGLAGQNTNPYSQWMPNQEEEETA